jgi:hypothetical protein
MKIAHHSDFDQARCQSQRAGTVEFFFCAANLGITLDEHKTQSLHRLKDPEFVSEPYLLKI